MASDNSTSPPVIALSEDSPKQRAMACIHAGRFEAARELFEQVCRADPSDVEAWFLLGAVNGQLGRIEEAIACCRQVIARQPGNADAYFNMAQAYMHQGQHREAAQAYREVVRLQPRRVEALNNLGYALQQFGSYEAAAASHRQALSLNPQDAEAFNNLGNALFGAGQRDEAETAYREALRIRPDYAEALNNLATVLQRQGRYRDAAAASEAALRHKPDYVEAYISHGTVLLMQGLYEAAERSYRKALEINPDSNKARSGLLFCLNYHSADPASVFREHKEWDVRHGQPLATCQDYANQADPERRLRIGYLSPDLRTHSVAYFFEPLLAHHDPARVTSVCYAEVARPDATTARLKTLAGEWRDITGQPPARVAEQIRNDGIDILVDLAGHTGQDLLLIFARKPAPVQVTYLGYPNTTGMAAMDYRFTDAWADPPGKTEQWHTETLVRLAHGFLCYEPGSEANLPVVALPSSQRKGQITFGSFNNLSKVTPQVVALWARILCAVADSRLVLKSKPFEDEAVRNYYLALFASAGVSPERLELVPYTPAVNSHLELYGRIDIALDPFPYNGTTTTCEALWMGVPVITLAGGTHAGRVGVSLLSQVGLAEFIALDEQAYVALAVELAGDPGRLARLRMSMRQRMKDSSLCDGASFAREVESAYRSMWRKWCVTRVSK